MDSIQKTIEKRITEMPDGQVFIPADFLDITKLVNINNALTRLFKRGVIRRPLRGIYSKPYLSDKLGIELMPSPDDVIAAVARKNRWRIAPSGPTAQNRLGLSAQIPATLEYVTSGPEKTYDYDGFKIRLRHRANRDMLENSPITLTFIQALKSLGKDNIDSTAISTLGRKLTVEQIKTICDETKTATSWIYGVARQLKEDSV
jgi:hypothetical protein